MRLPVLLDSYNYNLNNLNKYCFQTRVSQFDTLKQHTFVCDQDKICYKNGGFALGSLSL